jgi:hypothetical protein
MNNLNKSESEILRESFDVFLRKHEIILLHVITSLFYAKHDILITKAIDVTEYNRKYLNILFQDEKEPDNTFKNVCFFFKPRD